MNTTTAAANTTGSLIVRIGPAPAGTDTAEYARCTAERLSMLLSGASEATVNGLRVNTAADRLVMVVDDIVGVAVETPSLSGVLPILPDQTVTASVRW